MDVRLNETERLLFALLRMALHAEREDAIDWQGIPESCWRACYTLALEQGVAALAWDGLQTCAGEVVLPRDLKWRWGLFVQRCEQRHQRYCQVVTELQALYAREGIAMVQLKGVGFSACYPIPSHREGGDIDLYTWSADRAKWSDRDANRMADELMRQRGIDVETDHSPKHSNFFYQGIPIENHKTFLNVGSYPMAAPMDKLLRELLHPELVTLHEGNYCIAVPPSSFNALFLALHAAQHYGSGLRLHHLFDWACLLKRHGWCLPAQVQERGILRFIHALTYLSHHLLGTDPFAATEEGMADELLREMLHPPYDTNVPVTGRGAILRYKTQRLLHHHRLQCYVLSPSLRKRLWQSVVAHLRAPRTIFQTGREK